VTILPTVCFDQREQRLVHGQPDGRVVIYDTKSTSVVADFAAHKLPIAAVAFVSRGESLDVAVVAANLDDLRIWRCTRSGGLLHGLFTGSSTLHFVLQKSVPVPHARGMEAALQALHGKMHSEMIVATCSLKWLSPGCVELTTTWHHQVQVMV
jgi:WD40 repeat protein